MTGSLPACLDAIRLTSSYRITFAENDWDWISIQPESTVHRRPALYCRRFFRTYPMSR